MKFLNRHYRLILMLVPLISLAMHWSIFSRDLVGIHVWRQTQTQTVINNYYREDMNIFHPRINERPDTDRIINMEFPVMQWLAAVAYRGLGDSIAVSRGFMFLIGLLSVFGIFYLCKVLFKDNAIAVLGAWTFNFSPVFFYYTVNPLPDNFALCCGIWSVALFFRSMDSQKVVQVILSGLLLCLAILAKLPFILFGIVVPVYLFRLVKRKVITVSRAISICSVFLILSLPAVAWYVYAIPSWKGNGVTAGLFENRPPVAELLDIALHSLISTLPELLINYGSVLFFVAGFYFLFKRKAYRSEAFPALLAWSAAILIYFLFEMNMIAKVHDYYLFPFLPLIFLLVAYGAGQLLRSGKAMRYLAVVALAILPVTAYLRCHDRWNTEEPGFNVVYYEYKDELRGLIPQNAIVVAGNDDSHFILLYYLDRKGWAFDHNQLDGDLLNFYIEHGAAYLFTDSGVDRQEDIKSRLAEKIFEKDNLRVYKLK